MSNMSFSDAIAARVGPGYGLGPDVARSLVSTGEALDNLNATKAQCQQAQ